MACTNPVPVQEMSNARQTLQAAKQAQAQHFGTSRDVLIRIPPGDEKANVKLSDDILAALRTGNAEVEMRRVEFVGPQVGEELTEQGGLTIIYALIGILIWTLCEGGMLTGSREVVDRARGTHELADLVR